jgi:hypothetical protein
MTRAGYTPNGLNLDGIRTLRRYMKSILRTERHLDICADALKITKDQLLKILIDGTFPHISTATAVRIASATETSARDLLIAQVDTKLALTGDTPGMYPDVISSVVLPKPEDGVHDSLIMDDGFMIK